MPWSNKSSDVWLLHLAAVVSKCQCCTHWYYCNKIRKETKQELHNELLDEFLFFFTVLLLWKWWSREGAVKLPVQGMAAARPLALLLALGAITYLFLQSKTSYSSWRKIQEMRCLQVHIFVRIQTICFPGSGDNWGRHLWAGGEGCISLCWGANQSHTREDVLQGMKHGMTYKPSCKQKLPKLPIVSGFLLRILAEFKRIKINA